MITLEGAIERELRDLLAGEIDFVVWSVRGAPHHYLQADRILGLIRAEVVGARNGAVFSLGQYEALIALGWPDPSSRSGNHTTAWFPWRARRASQMLANTLTNVFGVASPQDIVTERGSRDDGGGGWAQRIFA